MSNLPPEWPYNSGAKAPPVEKYNVHEMRERAIKQGHLQKRGAYAGYTLDFGDLRTSEGLFILPASVIAAVSRKKKFNRKVTKVCEELLREANDILDRL